MNDRTMFQLKTKINWTNIPTDSKDNLRACEEFLSVVLDAHVVAAAKTLLASNDYEMVHDMYIAAALVEQYVKIGLPKPKPPQPTRRQMNKASWTTMPVCR